MSETEIKNQNMESQEEKETKVYEISFHIVPSLAEDDIKAEFEAIKKAILGTKESSVISEGHPVLRTLAYSLSKTVKAVKSNYTKAYFGWIKFETLSSEVSEIKKIAEEMPTIIRYLIISTVRENTMISKPEIAKDDTEGEEMDEEKAAEDIDQTIDNLVV